MNWMLAIVGAVTIVLALYLLAALFRPEDFS